jgi:hypothetical protein
MYTFKDLCNKINEEYNEEDDIDLSDYPSYFRKDSPKSSKIGSPTVVNFNLKNMKFALFNYVRKKYGDLHSKGPEYKTEMRNMDIEERRGIIHQRDLELIEQIDQIKNLSDMHEWIVGSLKNPDALNMIMALILWDTNVEFKNGGDIVYGEYPTPWANSYFLQVNY